MKLRASLLSIALIALSACGGSSDSTSRNRNGLLETTTIPGAVTTTIAGATTLPAAATTTVPAAVTTSTVAAVSTTTTVAAPQVTASTGPAPIIPTPTSTSTTSAPTTTLPKVAVEAVAKTFSEIFTDKKSCAQGGMCKVGDIGPGGGFVFNISESGFETPNIAVVNHFVEMAPISNFTSASLTSLSCNGRVASRGSLGVVATKALVDRCSLRKPIGPKLLDWYLPGEEDLYPLVDFFRNTRMLDSNGYSANIVRNLTDSIAKMSSTYFLTSIPNNCKDIPVDIFYPANFKMPFSGNGCYSPSHPDSGGFALAVRSFGPTTRPCATGGPCKTGDVGPHGGFVIQKYPGPGSPGLTFQPFFEAMTQSESLTVGPWCGRTGGALRNLSTRVGAGASNSETLRNDQWTGLPCDVVLTDFGQDNVRFAEGFVPSVEELSLLCIGVQKIKTLDPLARQQCGISSDFKNYNTDAHIDVAINSSHCPIAIVCRENRIGSFSKGKIDSIWTSSSKDGLPYVVTFGGSVKIQAPYLLNGQTFNDSRAVTIRFYAFDAVLAK